MGKKWNFHSGGNSNIQNNRSDLKQKTIVSHKLKPFFLNHYINVLNMRRHLWHIIYNLVIKNNSQINLNHNSSIEI